MSKLIIEIDIGRSEWEDSDPELFVELSKRFPTIHLEIGCTHSDPELADKGVYEACALSTEAYTARIEITEDAPETKLNETAN